MSITSVNPVLSPAAVQGVARDVVLQPGAVIDAEVLKVLADNLVRITIAGLALDVMTQVPLQAGQVLQLAVSQGEGGIRLAMVGQGAGAAGDAIADTITLASGARTEAPANVPATPAPPKSLLTPLEKLAVSSAVQTAAAQQGSLAPLFANLGVAARSGALPLKLQQAVVQVLAQQTGLDQNLTGAEVRNAFQKSGLFLEASLASGSPPAGIPDLKAALIVLRQTLLSSLGGAPPEATSQATSRATSRDTPRAFSQGTSQATSQAAPLDTLRGTLQVTPQGPAASAAGTEAPTHAPASPPAPPLSPAIDAPEVLLPQPRTAVIDELLAPGPRATITGATLSLLQEALQNAAPQSVTGTVREGNAVTFHTNTPPPPFRGAQPSAQPVALPSLPPDAPLATTAHHLLADTDAAIARQTLLQVASLPDRVEPSAARNDPAAPRWLFEIPFATPQGAAVAQFEISRDGGGSEVEAARRVWRAQFSLDVEPAGPVHALVSLVGEKTSVRMWAERPATTAQLRNGVAQLSQALARAELVPGDIVVRDGAPPQSRPAPAGHFLDRAL